MTYPDSDEARSRWQQVQSVRSSAPYKTTTMMLSVALLSVIAFGAGWVFFHQRTAPAAAPGTGPAAPAVTAPPAGDTGQLFGVATVDAAGRRLEVPVNPMGAVLPQRPATRAPASDSAPPDGLTWEQVYTTALPFSTSDGPTGITADGVPTGFADTPQGAAMAAIQISRRLASAPREQVAAIGTALLFTPTTATQEVAQEMVAIPDDLASSGGKGDIFTLTPIPLAVKVSGFAADYAHVEMAVRVGLSLQAQGIVAMRAPFDMVWRDGTWKWAVPTTQASPDSLYLRSFDPTWSQGWWQ